MVELIIKESGFPKDRETLTEMQQSWKKPIDELLKRLPGLRVLSGFTATHGGGGAVEYSEGVLLYDNKLWTIEPYIGTVNTTGNISFFEKTELGEFNVGTEENPIYEMRPWKVIRTAKVGDHAGYTHLVPMSKFLKGRKQLEYLRAGSVYVGLVVVESLTAIYHINFRENIGTKDYQVLGNFRAADPGTSFTRAFTWDINNRTNFGFDIYIDQVSANSIPLVFDYTVIPINRTQYLQEG